MTNNILYPFIMEKNNCIGRICDISDLANEIVSLHKYENEMQEEILVRFLVIANLIGQTLKEPDKKISIQIQGASGISLMVIDYMFPGQIRGYINYKSDIASADKSFLDLTQDAIMVINLTDYLLDKSYQSRVEILHNSIDKNFENYFNTSEQINTRILTSCSKQDGKWTARGIFVQQLPNSNHILIDEDGFSRVSLFLDTLDYKEFLYSNLGLIDILHRLFHQEGLEIYDNIEITRYCNCSREKLINILTSIPQESLLESSDNGKIDIKCDFCNNSHSFSFNEIFKGN